MKKYITIAALLAAGSACANASTITEDGPMTAPGNLYAGAFDFSFTISEITPVTGDYDIILSYYQVNGGRDHTVNSFQLAKNGELSLVRGNTLTLTEDKLTNNSTMNKNDSSLFKTDEGVAYVLSAGTYTVDYLGGSNGSAAADLYLEGVKVASFTGGSHNMNGAASGGLNLNVKVNDAYVIPEPSTFGLLAGLGALALVGTRRRRR